MDEVIKELIEILKETLKAVPFHFSKERNVLLQRLDRLEKYLDKMVADFKKSV